MCSFHPACQKETPFSFQNIVGFFSCWPDSFSSEEWTHQFSTFCCFFSLEMGKELQLYICMVYLVQQLSCRRALKWRIVLSISNSLVYMRNNPWYFEIDPLQFMTHCLHTKNTYVQSEFESWYQVFWSKGFFGVQYQATWSIKHQLAFLGTTII